MPILGFLIKNGNKTVYEWRTGHEPKQVEKKQDTVYNFKDDDEESTENNEDKIDFDVVDFNIDSNAVSTDIVDQVFSARSILIFTNFMF